MSVYDEEPEEIHEHTHTHTQTHTQADEELHSHRMLRSGSKSPLERYLYKPTLYTHKYLLNPLYLHAHRMLREHRSGVEGPLVSDREHAHIHIHA
jgi:hypothetical protein